jgi:hypothetical protein
MTASIFLNAFGVVALRLFQPYNGVWWAEADIDPGAPLAALPPGPASITIGQNAPIIGTIDPNAQGIFGARAGARVVGGRGGWGQSVPPQHFHNDAGLVDATVILTTAAAVGEVAVVAVPQAIGVDYVRVAGPASSVLDGLDWHVDLLGNTQVAPRVPVPLDPTTYDVMTFDPVAQRVLLASDAIVPPGAILTDVRFGTLTVLDVEQTWDAKGARAECWCGTGAVSRLDASLGTFVKQRTRIAYARCYEYRVITQNVDGRVQLQPLSLTGPAPVTLPLTIWPGMSGLSAELTPGTVVLVHFAEGDPSKPVVMGFRGDATPLTLTLDALSPNGVIVGGVAPQPVVKFGTSLAGFLKWATAVEAGLSSHTAIDPASSIAVQGVAMQSTKLGTD